MCWCGMCCISSLLNLLFLWCTTFSLWALTLASAFWGTSSLWGTSSTTLTSSFRMTSALWLSFLCTFWTWSSSRFTFRFWFSNCSFTGWSSSTFGFWFSSYLVTLRLWSSFWRTSLLWGFSFLFSSFFLWLTLSLSLFNWNFTMFSFPISFFFFIVMFQFGSMIFKLFLILVTNMFPSFSNMFC